MPGQGQKAVFLDRDGVLNRVHLQGGVAHPPPTVEEFEFLPGAAEAARHLAGAGFALVVVTNQPDVARKLQTLERAEAMNDVVRQALPVLEVRACYHDDADGCDCRKPKPGMLLSAARRWGLDLSGSFMVGDRWSDVAAGQAAGCVSLLVATPWGAPERCRPAHVVRDLAEAAAWILHSSRGAP
jgi:D-glycero-D-manno-heptose 1,7-bisphosphate phosphatase